MSMRVDPARHDEAVLGVEGAVAPQAFADRLDGLALDQHVGLVGAVRGDDRSAFNDERHFYSPKTLFPRAVASPLGRPWPLRYDLGLFQHRMHQHIGASRRPIR